jgi:pSer/pThr/pTyr-binding forkhead associated (FHA) protein
LKLVILIVTKGPDQGDRFKLADSDSIVLGRNSAQVELSDGMISRYHARLKRKENCVWYISDLGSRNGTKLNDVLLKDTVRLEPGDRITIGYTTLEFTAIETIAFEQEEDGPAEHLVEVVTYDDVCEDLERAHEPYQVDAFEQLVNQELEATEENIEEHGEVSESGEVADVDVAQNRPNNNQVAASQDGVQETTDADKEVRLDSALETELDSEVPIENGQEELEQELSIEDEEIMEELAGQWAMQETETISAPAPVVASELNNVNDIDGESVADVWQNAVVSQIDVCEQQGWEEDDELDVPENASHSISSQIIKSPEGEVDANDRLRHLLDIDEMTQVDQSPAARDSNFTPVTK